MTKDMRLVVGSVVASLVAVPAVVLYLTTVRGVPSSDVGLLATALVAMSPGLSMGATALWLCARG